MTEDPIILRDLSHGDIGWLTQMHGELYARDEGFDMTFEALVAGILADFVQHRDPAAERGWIAERDGRRLGSIFCVRQGEPGVAKLRLFLLVPEARGLGLGRRLLQECLDFARSRGYVRLSLWTHKSHVAACALYRKSGFRMVDETPGREFGMDVVSQNWEIDL